MKAIPIWFTVESVKLEGVTKRRVLTTLKVIYERGTSSHGKTAEFLRDVDSFVVGVHGRSQHFFETYERTIGVDIHSRRTIFRYAGLTSKANNSSWWKRLLAELHIRRLQAIKI